MITDLRLQNFRSYKDSSFEISPGVNIVVGPNASGKTNLLESVLVLARGQSYRAKDNELVKTGKPWLRIDADMSEGGKRTVKVVIEPESSKTYEIAGKQYKRLDLQNSLALVLFEPNHLLLLGSSPDRRRDYLDDLIEQIKPGYGSLRRQYKRALAQRNRLLKQSHRASQSQVFPWDVRLSQLAGQIVRARAELTNKINKEIPKVYKQISGAKTSVSVEYQNQWPVESYETKMLKKLETSFVDDHLRGFTSVGPHREDLEVLFDGRAAQVAASRGEVRTAVLALKIIELKLIEAARAQTPILLLDDVFSELDGRRRHTLTDHLAPYQTFITTTDADLIIKNFTQKSHVIAL